MRTVEVRVENTGNNLIAFIELSFEKIEVSLRTYKII